MKKIHGVGFDEVRHSYVPRIHANCVSCMKTICDQVVELGMVSKVAQREQFELIKTVSPEDALTEEVGDAISKLWECDPAVRSAWERRSEYQIIESNAEYFKKIKEISTFGERGWGGIG